ncbi:response regulator transcription factor [Niabella insulamsoli]|uniref:response regulator transcription factor n=1 Tax=Niabella insulamsoli TaxID=3144874 RepID=UPI0031FC444B
MKILLIEDEPSVANIINKGLNENGYHISIAPDGTTGLDLALTSDYDIIILDIMLPGINGMQLCKTIREHKIDTPILFLTALGTTENIVAGLNAGADDYLVKPFKFIELEARIRSLSRRRGLVAELEDTFETGDLVLNRSSKIVTLKGQPVNLTATEFRLLDFLIKNKNKVVSRIEILEHVWGINFNMGTNVVDVYINYLRKKIDTDAEQKLIQTVIGMGYMFKVS